MPALQQAGSGYQSLHIPAATARAGRDSAIREVGYQGLGYFSAFPTSKIVNRHLTSLFIRRFCDYLPESFYLTRYTGPDIFHNRFTMYHGFGYDTVKGKVSGYLHSLMRAVVLNSTSVVLIDIVLVDASQNLYSKMTAYAKNTLQVMDAR